MSNFINLIFLCVYLQQEWKGKWRKCKFFCWMYLKARVLKQVLRFWHYKIWERITMDAIIYFICYNTFLVFFSQKWFCEFYIQIWNMSGSLLEVIVKIYEILLKYLQVSWYGVGNVVQEILIFLLDFVIFYLINAFLNFYYHISIASKCIWSQRLIDFQLEKASLHYC